MANRTRQVQIKFDEPFVRKFLNFELESEGTSTRRYPCEHEGRYLAKYLNSLSILPVERKALLEALGIRGRARLRKTAFEDYLTDGIMSAMRKSHWILDRQEVGFVFYPTTPEGRAARAVAVLEAKRRTDRIKQCLHCKTWFYARFKHQQFCPDPKKKCQFNHYHSPEWRKKHRERTKQLQKEYRERIFGKELVAHK
jgi:hypothetical protein